MATESSSMAVHSDDVLLRVTECLRRHRRLLVRVHLSVHEVLLAHLLLDPFDHLVHARRRHPEQLAETLVRHQPERHILLEVTVGEVRLPLARRHLLHRRADAVELNVGLVGVLASVPLRDVRAVGPLEVVVDVHDVTRRTVGRASTQVAHGTGDGLLDRPRHCHVLVVQLVKPVVRDLVGLIVELDHTVKLLRTPLRPEHAHEAAVVHDGVGGREGDGNKRRVTLHLQPDDLLNHRRVLRDRRTGLGGATNHVLDTHEVDLLRVLLHTAHIRQRRHPDDVHTLAQLLEHLVSRPVEAARRGHRHDACVVVTVRNDLSQRWPVREHRQRDKDVLAPGDDVLRVLRNLRGLVLADFTRTRTRRVVDLHPVRRQVTVPDIRLADTTWRCERRVQVDRVSASAHIAHHHVGGVPAAADADDGLVTAAVHAPPQPAGRDAQENTAHRHCPDPPFPHDTESKKYRNC
eukprot:Hpha_TRINITY_DN13886_c0_g1::TRINITY_DN13886_c0_g1_i2::g.70128::m.70128